MKMKKSILLMAVGMICLSMLIGGCQPAQNPTSSSTPTPNTQPSNTSETSSAPAPWNFEYVLGSGSATGNSKIFATAVAKVITENVEGVRVSAAVTPGYDAESVMLTYEGTYVGGVGTPIVLDNAINGVDPFPSEGIKLSYWFSHQEIPLNIFALGSLGITEVSELKGKKLATGVPGTGNYIMTEVLLEACGLSVSDVDLQFMDASEGFTRLKDGHVDAVSYVRGFSGAVIELSASRDIVLLQPSQDAARTLPEAYSWIGPEEWPFREQYSSIAVPGAGLCLINPEGMFLSSELPEDVVYEMTKAVFEHQEEIRKCSDVYSNFTIDAALTKVPIDVHPGALRYYQEVNVEGWQDFVK